MTHTCFTLWHIRTSITVDIKPFLYDSLLYLLRTLFSGQGRVVFSTKISTLFPCPSKFRSSGHLHRAKQPNEVRMVFGSEYSVWRPKTLVGSFECDRSCSGRGRKTCGGQPPHPRPIPAPKQGGRSSSRAEVPLKALRAILRAWTAQAVLNEAEKGGDPLEAKYGLLSELWSWCSHHVITVWALDDYYWDHPVITLVGQR